jgi:hypothetical protein
LKNVDFEGDAGEIHFLDIRVPEVFSTMQRSYHVIDESRAHRRP